MTSNPVSIIEQPESPPLQACFEYLEKFQFSRHRKFTSCLSQRYFSEPNLLRRIQHLQKTTRNMFRKDLISLRHIVLARSREMTDNHKINIKIRFNGDCVSPQKIHLFPQTKNLVSKQLCFQQKFLKVQLRLFSINPK